jgi:hypothetical protein
MIFLDTSAVLIIFEKLIVASHGLIPTASKSTRTFSDFETVADAMNGICQLYEQRLKQLNPGLLLEITPSSKPDMKSDMNKLTCRCYSMLYAHWVSWLQECAT